MNYLIRITFCSMFFVVSTVLHATTYDLDKLCGKYLASSTESGEKHSIEITKDKNCSFILTCIESKPVITHVLLNCGGGKEYYSFGVKTPGYNSYVNSIRWKYDEIAFSVVDIDVFGKEVKSRLIKGNLKTQADIVSESKSDGFIKFEEINGTEKINHFKVSPCSKGSIKLALFNGCFEKIAPVKN